jgi:predicted enzyme related to lactoylglutathione lyase
MRCLALILSWWLWAAAAAAESAPVAVAPQYDTTHVYVAPEEVDGFVASFVATFGGSASPPAVTTVTPTPSRTIFRAVRTPVGGLSVFGFTTPVPFPFGQERTGYLVTNMDAAVAAARAAGADVIVAPFADPIGRDAIIQWPGGVNMQLYWHTKAPSSPPLQSIPENRVYVSPDRAAAFVAAFVSFAHGAVASDEPQAPGVEIGRPGETYRRIRIESAFGRMSVAVTEGHLPYPYGRETTGYEVRDLEETLAKAKAAGAEVLLGPYAAATRKAAMVRFPGGYVAEVHAVSAGVSPRVKPWPGPAAAPTQRREQTARRSRTPASRRRGTTRRRSSRRKRRSGCRAAA